MRRLAALLSLVLAAAGCGGGSSAAPPGWVTLALANSPVNLDPGVGLDEASQKIHTLLFSSLLKYDANFRPVPDLAVRFEADGPLRYIAGIPAGVHFHDGREMTSADVAFTFRRFLDKAFVSGRKGAFTDLDAVEIVDRYTVAFQLKRPSGAFPIVLVQMGIVPDGTTSASRLPIGSGPYRFVEFAPDDHVTLAAFDGYYGGRPRNDGLVFRVVPDDTMRGLELRKGDVDLVVNDVPPDIVHTLASDPDLAVITGAGTDYAYIGVNLRDPALADRRVRQAIAYAIDRHAIVEYLRRGFAQETAGILPAMSWAYAGDMPQFHYDPERAMALLDEAGYRDPDGPGPQPRLRLTLKTSTAEAYRLQAMILQQQLAQVGIAMDIRSYEFATLSADVARGNVQLYTLIFVGGVVDPDILRRVFHSSQVPPSGFNRGHYRNPEVDRLLDLATAAVSEADRRASYVDAERLIADDVPLVSLWTRTNVAVARRELRGVRLSPIADFDFLRDVSR